MEKICSDEFLVCDALLCRSRLYAGQGLRSSSDISVVGARIISLRIGLCLQVGGLTAVLMKGLGDDQWSTPPYTLHD